MHTQMNVIKHNLAVFHPGNNAKIRSLATKQWTYFKMEAHTLNVPVDGAFKYNQRSSRLLWQQTLVYVIEVGLQSMCAFVCLLCLFLHYIRRQSGPAPSRRWHSFVSTLAHESPCRRCWDPRVLIRVGERWEERWERSTEMSGDERGVTGPLLQESYRDHLSNQL